MTKAELKRHVLRLPLEQQLELAEDIWEGVERGTVQPPLPEWQRQILRERIAEEDADPESGSPWDEVKQRILASL